MPAYSPTASKLARYLGGAIAALFIAPATWAQDASAQHAESFPTRAIEVVLPAPPGGTLDAAIRILAEQAHDVFDQRVVPMNRTGAGGNIAGEAVARAQPDGYTLLLGTDAIHSANAHLYSRMGFDGVKDFAPVMLVGSFPIIMTVRDDFPAQNLEEFIAYVRANPGKFTYGSPGLGTTQHLMAETRAKLESAGIIVINGGQQDLAQVIARDFASRGELLQSLNIKLD